MFIKCAADAGLFASNLSLVGMAGLMNEPAYVSETLLEGLPVSGEDIYRMDADQVAEFALLSGPDGGDPWVYASRGRDHFNRWISWLHKNPDVLQAGLRDLDAREAHDLFDSTIRTMELIGDPISDPGEQRQELRKFVALKSCKLAYYGEDCHVFEHFVLMTNLFEDFDNWQRLEWLGMVGHFLHKSNPFLRLVIVNSIGSLIGGMVWEELNCLDIGLASFTMRFDDDKIWRDASLRSVHYLKNNLEHKVGRSHDVPGKDSLYDVGERLLRGWGMEDVHIDEGLAQRYVEQSIEAMNVPEPHSRMESILALSKAIAVGAPENRLGRALDLIHFLVDEDYHIRDQAVAAWGGIDTLYLDPHDRLELSFKLFDLLVQSRDPDPSRDEFDHYGNLKVWLNDALCEFDIDFIRKFLERMAVLSEKAPTAKERAEAREWFDAFYDTTPSENDELEALDVFDKALWGLYPDRAKNLFRRLSTIEEEGPLALKRTLVNAYHEDMLDESGWSRDSHYFDYIAKAGVSIENLSDLDEDGLNELMVRLIKLEVEASDASYNARRKS